jgi:hypothetical protein
MAFRVVCEAPVEQLAQARRRHGATGAIGAQPPQASTSADRPAFVLDPGQDLHGTTFDDGLTSKPSATGETVFSMSVSSE